MIEGICGWREAIEDEVVTIIEYRGTKVFIRDVPEEGDLYYNATPSVTHLLDQQRRLIDQQRRFGVSITAASE